MTRILAPNHLQGKERRNAFNFYPEEHHYLNSPYYRNLRDFTILTDLQTKEK